MLLLLLLLSLRWFHGGSSNLPLVFTFLTLFLINTNLISYVGFEVSINTKLRDKVIE